MHLEGQEPEINLTCSGSQDFPIARQDRNLILRDYLPMFLKYSASKISFILSEVRVKLEFYTTPFTNQQQINI